MCPGERVGAGGRAAAGRLCERADSGACPGREHAAADAAPGRGDQRAHDSGDERAHSSDRRPDGAD